VIYTDLSFVEGHEVVCEVCRGQRFTPEVLADKVNGHSIAEVEGLTIDQALGELPDEHIVVSCGSWVRSGSGTCGWDTLWGWGSVSG
jgi:excinuclease UvrABC ATPase subunit